MTSVGWFELAVIHVAILSAGVSTILLLVAWYRREGILRRGSSVSAAAQVPRFELGRTPFAGDMLDVANEVRTALARLAPVAARAFVQLEMAVQPELAVRADPRALGQALNDLIGNAIAHTPCGHVLVGAMRYSGRVQISVTDDGAGPPEATQEATLRDAERLIALQGGTIQIESHTRQGGSTVLLRLPEPLSHGRAAIQDANPATTEPEPGKDTAAATDIAGLVWGR